LPLPVKSILKVVVLRGCTGEKFMAIQNNRVVVTGIGIISPVGLSAAETWQNLVAGKSGIDYITLFDVNSFNCKTKFAGEAKGFDPLNYVDRKSARRMDRFSQMGVAAAKEALTQANLQIGPENQNGIGVFIGSGIGGLTTLYEQTKTLIEKGADRVSPFLVPMMISDMAAAQISILLGIKGPNLGITSACSSGSDAIGAAFELIRRGTIPAMLAGGSEAIINPIGISAFNALNALSTRNDNPKQASRPFDARRDGFVIAEGAAVMVLERLDYAKKRGAAILAEILAYGASGDAFHITEPAEDGEGATRAMKAALGVAGIQPSEIDYINAHGTSTQLNDRVETLAIKNTFGDHARKLAISSTKSMTGHLIGAAGSLAGSVCVMTIRNGIIPPTINYTYPDPNCDLDYVPNVARQARVRTAMSNSFGFGGHNSVLIWREYNE
jgi:3-oxoacyl-[acyl-carrier-protein] synthase II